MKRDHLLHPLFASHWRVWVRVKFLGHLRIGLAGHHPARIVELVATIVGGDNVNQHYILCLLV